MGLGLALFGVLLAAISMVRFWSGHYDGWAFGAWLAAIDLYLVGVWLDGPSPARGTEVQAEKAWQQPKLDRRLVCSLLALILLVAVATRFYALDTFPNGCQSDECNRCGAFAGRCRLDHPGDVARSRGSRCTSNLR